MKNTYILGNHLLVESSLIIESTVLNCLEQALVLVQKELQAFASKPDFAQKMVVAFGEGIEVDSLKAAWLTEDFSILPQIEIRHTTELNGANGAYGAAINRIYLSWEYLQANQRNIESILGLLLEEFGHRVDSFLNAKDSAGDEGAIFSALVRGESLSSQQLQYLKTEEDKTVIRLDGQMIYVEQQQGIITVTNNNDSGVGSFRWAIEQANSNQGLDTIFFSIGEGGAQTIQPLSSLPDITDSVIINAATQPGYNGTPLIELDGSLAGDNANGLVIRAGKSTVKGLVINRFESGIRLLSNGDNTIQGNFIGTDITGTIDLGNRNEGIYINSSDNLIGGSNTQEKNLISGNNGRGIFLQDAPASGNRIVNNYIGTDITGTAAIGNNEGIGIVNGSNNIVENNLVSGNNNTGIGIFSFGGVAKNNQVINNYVGTNKDVTDNLGNGNVGVDLPGAVDTLLRSNVIGGNAPVGISLRSSQRTIVENNYIGTNVIGTLNLANQGSGISDDSNASNSIIRNNTIAFNPVAGIFVVGIGHLIESNQIYSNHKGIIVEASGVNNSILKNAIYDNNQLGIDLSNDGVTSNDLGDSDTGANSLQNHPIITSANTNDGILTTIGGSLNSQANQTYRLEFFSNSSVDESNHGEGKTYLGFVNVTTDISGNANFSFQPSTVVPVGQFITATATGTSGNTSEFSRAITVDNTAKLEFSTANYTVREDGTAVTDIIVTRTGRATGTVSATITFADGTATGCGCAANSVNNDFYNGAFTITLADGETSKVIPVELASLGGTNAIRIRNDAKIEGDETFTINLTNPTGGAVIGNQASATVKILDDDVVPSLSVTFNQNSIAENAGNSATTATVTRSVVTNTPLVVSLTSSDTTEAKVPQQVTIAAGQASATFIVDAVDDAIVDGTQIITIIATPLNPDTNIPLNEGTGSNTIQVMDNESPILSLTLDKNIISETGTTTANLTRNFITNQDLIVSLTSSDTTEATVPSTVIIPANQASATFTVTGLRDGESDGLQTIEITISADGFNPVVTPIKVSDADIPDLVVSQISTPSGFIKESSTIIYRTENKGLKEATGTWVDRVYLSTDNRLSTDDKLIAENPFEGTVTVNSGYEKSVSLTLPDKPGKYYLIAATDTTAQVDEGGITGESNNTIVSVPFEVMATYSATVSTNVETEVAGNPVELKGQAISKIDGSPVAFAPVTIFIENNGFRRELGAITNAQGNFQTFFTPLPGEGGVYNINAAYQGYFQEDSAPEDQFKILGMGFEPGKASHNIFAGLPFTNKVILENFSEISLSGITATVEGAPENWTVQVEALPNLLGNGENELFYTILAPDESVVQDKFNIRLSSVEGVKAILPVTINLDRPLPRLEANTNLIQKGVVRGNQASVDVQITNQGLSAVEDVDILLPNLPWLSLASPSKIPFLARGESATLTFLLTPSEDLPLTLYEGTIVLDALGNSADLSLPFQFRTLSEAVGDLRVDVVDEYTFYVEGKPQVDEAKVRLIDPFTNQVVSQFITNETGEVFFDDVKEGRYYLQIMADGHQSYFSTVDIKSGLETEKEVFLQREFVRYRWVVQPTEIPDRYTFTLETVFETDVPAPVVTIDPQVYDLSQLTESVNIINYTVANHGLIAAENFQLNFADHPLWEVDPLIDKIDILAPNSFVTIPVKITKLSSLEGTSTISSALEPSIRFPDTALSSYINQTELTNNALSSLEPTVIIPKDFATSVLLPAEINSFQPVLELSDATSATEKIYFDVPKISNEPFYSNLPLVSVQEGNEGTNKTVQIKVKRESLFDIPLDQIVEIDYQTKPISTSKNLATATSGLDYEAVNGKLVFAPGETEKFIEIKILGDNLIESSYYESSYNKDINNQLNNVDSGDFELFTIELSNARYASGQGEIIMSDPISAVVEIKDDDVYLVEIVEVKGKKVVVFNDKAPDFPKSQISPQLLDEIERSYKEDAWTPTTIFVDSFYDSKLGFFRSYGTTVGKLVEDYLNSTKENPIHAEPIIFKHSIDENGIDRYESSQVGYDAREIIEGIGSLPILNIAGFRNQAITKNYVAAIKNKLDSVIKRGIIPDGTGSYDIQSKSNLLKLGFSEQEATEFLYYVNPNYSSEGEQYFYDEYGNSIDGPPLNISSPAIFNLDYTPKLFSIPNLLYFNPLFDVENVGVSIPELIAGGVGASNYPTGKPRLDTRKLTGIVTVTKQKEKNKSIFSCFQEEETNTFNIEYNNFEITIEDGFDFAPGNLGSPTATLLTLPLQQLEVNNRAFDVPFKVIFQVDSKPKKEYVYVTIPGEGDYNYNCGGERSGQDDVVLTNAGSGQSELSCNIVPSSYSPSAGIRPIEYIQNICSPTNASANSSSLSLSSDDSVCARVKVRFSQDAVMTRSAFLGTLILENEREITDLENVSISLEIRDAGGNLVNNLFGITPPLLSGLTGIDGTGTVKAKSSGKAEFTFIPTNNAASEEQTIYTIGGTLSYKDAGQQVTVPLAAVPITVLPQAELSLNYFQQRDVFADDPFTSTIEPSLPFSLGLIVKNSGKGAANNLQIQSAQPKIVDNEKGLLIDFKLIGTQLGAASLSPALNLTIGNIDPGKTRVAQWQFTSSLQGKFVDYKASFEHINDLGLPELSLVKETKIHELIRKVQVDYPTDDNLPDFLVNDIKDDNFTPDTLYFSSGGTAPVKAVTNATTDGAATFEDLTVQVSANVESGWSYLRLLDPGNGQFQVKRVVRANGTEVVLDNVWTTDRTFPATGRPTYENILHLIDNNITAGAQTYTITYTTGDQTPPKVREIVDVDPNPRNTPINTIDVVFTEPIKASTFDNSDIGLTLDGVAVNTNNLSISQVNSNTYRIGNLQSVTGNVGQYQLSVNAAGVQDFEGLSGIGVVNESWVFTGDRPAVAGIVGFTSTRLNTSINNPITVTFTEAINPSSFDFNDLFLNRDGGGDLIKNTVTIAPINSTTYQISNLGDLTNVDGEYTFLVNARGVVDTDVNTGVGAKGFTWTLNTNAPRLQSITDVTSPRNTKVSSLNIAFSKAIDSTTFDLSDIILTRDGTTNLLTSSTNLTQLNDTTYRLNGLTGLQSTDGTYSLAVVGSGIKDANGNVVTNSLTENWTLDTIAPASATNVQITNGVVNESGQIRVNNTSIDITGSLSETGLKVYIRDKNLNQSLAQASVSGTSFNVSVQLSGAGARELEIQVVDAAGNTTTTPLNLFADITKPAITQFLNLPETPTLNPVNYVDVKFSEQINLSTFDRSDITLTRNGETVTLPNTVTIEYLSDTTYRINGLNNLTNTPGNYQLRVDATTIQDNAGNNGDIARTASFTISAPVTPGVTFTQTNGSTTVTEAGNSDTYTLVLRTQPTSDVTITLAPGNQITSDKTTLTFTTTNWNIPQTITVTAVNDTTPEGNHNSTITHSISSNDANYNSLTLPNINIAIQDNDVEIRGVVWNDVNGNSIKDNGESLLTGWTVYLDTNNNSQLDAGETSTLTDSQGNYTFNDLRPGTYNVAQVVQDGWKQTYPIINVTTTASTAEIFTPSAPLSTISNTQATTATNLINLDDFVADTRFTNIKGQGYATVIIDTGADLDHPLFGADNNGDGIADRIIYQYDFADKDNNASDKSGHGSHIASIAASIAPGANIIVLKVFKDSGSGSFSDLEAALQWVNQNADKYNIASVNLSVGDGQNWSTGNSRYGIGDELAAIASKNIIVAAAAGNSFYQFNSNPGLAYPAADPNTIAVGAVWADNFGTNKTFGGGAVDNTTDSDRIASFSQRHATLLDVFAPGIFITGANATGGTQTMGGTSQAVPFISGIAVLAQQIATEKLGRQLTLTEFRTLLDNTSVLINDGDNENDNVNNTGLNFPRVNMLALAEGILNLNTTTPTSGNSNPNANSSDDPLYLPSGSTKLNHTVTLTAGQIASDINFGNQLINKAPTLTNISKSGNENNVINFSQTNFTTAFNDADGNSLSKIQILSLPNNGVLQLNGTNVVLNQEVTLSNLNNLTFTPNPNFDGTVSFNWNGFDGEVYALNPASINLTVLNVINGTSNNETINGTNRNDVLDGGAGNDRLVGGLGDDIYIVDSSRDVVVEAPSEGRDTVKLAANYTLTNNIEDLVLTGASNITGTGNDLDNTITGNSGSNTLKGLGGNDILLGGAGSDILVGGAGNDILTGGADADQFLFGSGAAFNTNAFGVDTITDFNKAADKIVLSKASFTALSSAVNTSLAVNEFATIQTNLANEVSIAGGSGAKIVYNSTTGNLLYNQHGTAAGLGSGGLFATFTTLTNVESNSFFVQA